MTTNHNGPEGTQPRPTAPEPRELRPCPYCRAPMHPAMEDRYGACCPDHGGVVEAREEADELRARITELERARDEALRQGAIARKWAAIWKQGTICERQSAEESEAMLREAIEDRSSQPALPLAEPYPSVSDYHRVVAGLVKARRALMDRQPSHPDCFFVRREDLAAVGRLAFAKPLDQPPTDNGPGALEIGTNERGEVVMNLPRDMTGHITFSPDEAEHLSTVMARQAAAARESAARQQPPGAGTEGA
jgi:hypothetical protein